MAPYKNLPGNTGRSLVYALQNNAAEEAGDDRDRQQNDTGDDAQANPGIAGAGTYGIGHVPERSKGICASDGEACARRAMSGWTSSTSCL